MEMYSSFFVSHITKTSRTPSLLLSVSEDLAVCLCSVSKIRFWIVKSEPFHLNLAGRSDWQNLCDWLLFIHYDVKCDVISSLIIDVLI